MDNFLLDGKGKLWHEFASADVLEEVDIGNGNRPRLTFISTKLDPEFKQELVALLKEFWDCFTWEYYEMPGLDWSIIDIDCQSNQGNDRISIVLGDVK